MKLAVISFTRTGEGICEKLSKALSAAGADCPGYSGRKTGNAGSMLQPVSGTLSEWTGQQFAACDGLIFIGAAGIAVRLIAPYLLSGHVGGANRLTEWIAKILDAVPVVTTASDVRGRTAIDVWAADHGLVLTDRKLAKEIAAALLDGETVGYFSDYPISQPEGTGYEADVVHRLNVWVTCRRQEAPGIFLRLIPKKLVLGIGCRRGTPGDVIETAVRETLEEHHLDIHGVSGVASIDLKKDEAGLLETATGLGIPFSTYSSEELAAVQGDFSESGFVRQVTGVGNVCERSALCCAGTGGRLIVKKQVHNGVTVAVAEKTGGK